MGNVQTLHHVTSAGEDIRRSGEMKPGSSGMAGGGIYFADNWHAAETKAHSRGYRVTAQVDLGRVKTVDKQGTSRYRHCTEQQLRREGYDSIHITGLATGDEYVVYDNSRVRSVSVEREPDACAIQ
mmetsp:Transcript_116443/g.336365  ORF Transcript_116443/g.336365 Transcript_116443/m.336365 type:complete len:126 (+) Transcript_116443:66-443(+)